MVPDFTLLKTDTSDIIILGLTCALVIMHRHCLPLITMLTDMDIRLIITERCLLIL